MEVAGICVHGSPKPPLSQPHSASPQPSLLQHKRSVLSPMYRGCKGTKPMPLSPQWASTPSTHPPAPAPRKLPDLTVSQHTVMGAGTLKQHGADRGSAES